MTATILEKVRAFHRSGDVKTVRGSGGKIQKASCGTYFLYDATYQTASTTAVFLNGCFGKVKEEIIMAACQTSYGDNWQVFYEYAKDTATEMKEQWRQLFV